MERMATQKFQVTYSPVDDLVMVLMVQEDDTELDFAMTRRLVKQLWPGLGRIVNQASEVVQQDTRAHVAPGPAPAAARVDHRVAVALAKEKVKEELADGDPAKAAKPGETPPPLTQEGPVVKPARTRRIYLTRKLQVVDKDERMKIMILSDGKTTLRLPFSPHQILAFADGLKQVIQRADWDLKLDFEWDRPAADDSSRELAIDITAESPSRYRH